MSGVFIGSTELTTVGDIKIGGTDVQEVYVGSTKVFPTGGGFLPTDHGDDLQFWWDATQGVVEGVSPDVASWTDQKAGLVAVPIVNAPHLVDPAINNLPGIDFDLGDNNTFLRAPASVALNNIWTKGTSTTLWCAFNWDNSLSDGYLWSKGWGNSNGWAFIGRGTDAFRWRQRGSGASMDRSTVETFTQPKTYLVQITWNGDMFTMPALKVDKVLTTWDGAAPGGVITDDSTSDFTIGQTDTAASNLYLKNYMLEFYVTVDSAISETEDENYLISKWGITV